MEKYIIANFRAVSIGYLFGMLLIFPAMAQEEKPVKSDSLSHSNYSHQNNVDSRYSVFGPPQPAQWKFQLSYRNNDNKGASSFNFYRKDQRDKTIYFSMLNNGLDNTNQYRVQQISGGIILFPFNDDDRYQFDLGGTFDKIKDTTLNNLTFFSRFTYRPNRELWIRVGYEYYDGYDLGQGINPYMNTTLNSYYIAAKYKLGFFSPVAVIGRGNADENINNRIGGGVLLEGPFETYAFGGYIKSTDEFESTRTLAFGRWAPFRSDGFPSGFFVWKHQSDYDFQLGGIFFGRRNRFVHPAAVGMLTGMFISSITLRVNSLLRQRKLMMITDDYENSDYSFYYVHLNQEITSTSNVGFTVLQFFKFFTDTEFWIFNEPVVGLFYNEETNPIFDINTFSLSDKKENYFSYQIGTKIFNNILIEAIHAPTRAEFTFAIAYLLK
ncbi:MAG: hypothetical protein OQJ93_06025 [Ignavibacteriaceae bacterium]|jgi:hypothetical protein|nr:hypothetical protein [Ignavibacteriaceae bacterium]MCW8813092.1 hypothetical protein [Chlorobium sp.]MCW8996015.1 hypothetical protein [Psychromonas sp.]MCW8822531.1 hypothetical protein [Ignavibacteriaceae bacterium]MCW8961017.1 hypothetical protein [Ignavibacteriaceae bacterium]